MQNMACIIWLMSIISNAEYGLYYLANVDNKYMQNMGCISWLMSIIEIYAEYGLYYLANVNNK